MLEGESWKLLELMCSGGEGRPSFGGDEHVLQEDQANIRLGNFFSHTSRTPRGLEWISSCVIVSPLPWNANGEHQHWESSQQASSLEQSVPSVPGMNRYGLSHNDVDNPFLPCMIDGEDEA